MPRAQGAMVPPSRLAQAGLPISRRFLIGWIDWNDT
jgi:hypothetical protein